MAYYKWKNYKERWFEAVNTAHLNNLPLKRTRFLYSNEMEVNARGYTELYGDRAVVDKLDPEKFKVYVHEVVHTPDEKETRYIDREMVSEEMPPYLRKLFENSNN